MSAGGLSAIILAGTYDWSGSRFEALGPRPLVPVALSPLISYALRWLHGGGLERVTVCANGATWSVRAALGDGVGLGLSIDYHLDTTPRGAAGCVRDAARGTDAETLVIADGTVIPTVDLGELLDAHRRSGAAVTAVVHREASRGAALTPGGAYVFSRRVLGQIPETGFQDIKENLIPRLHRSGERVIAHESGGACPRVLNALTYLAVNEWMLERLALEPGERGEVLAHPSAWVEQGARLVGPVQLGPGVHVRAGATIVGPTSIGADSRIDSGALVARSVVWSRCRVGEGAVVHGSVVGNEVVVRAGGRVFHDVHPRRTPEPSPLLSHLRRLPARAVPGPALP